MISENHAALNEALDAYWANKRKDMSAKVEEVVRSAYRTFEVERGRRPVQTILKANFMQLLEREGLLQ